MNKSNVSHDMPKNKTQLLHYLKGHIGIELIHIFSSNDEQIHQDGSRQLLGQRTLQPEILRVHSVKRNAFGLIELERDQSLSPRWTWITPKHIVECTADYFAISHIHQWHNNTGHCESTVRLEYRYQK
ncbi:hypothetical protein YDYSY3_38410 [Paenibacillus chitinolyticus]|uniref:hypothetical protein n=1 Tax=Paenibacillus chitinolyticus TaxID=79263 RepID=UPI0026E4F395|nr:hypothetical protein [Paenibacillus chitinolyticus]GKS12841.1 hypothetical protein YDYSY3_38410 [Paenibacillus chitinolyticus]